MKRGLILSMLLVACAKPTPGADGGADDAGSGEPQWRVVLDGVPATLLSAWEAPDGVLYVVGGTSTSALVLRHDTAGWWQMDPGTGHALWWVYGFSSSDVYAVGDQGVITHFDGRRWSVEQEGGDFTLFGLWGRSTADLVAVGGTVASSAPRGVMLTKSSDWGEVAAPSTEPLFKVWGTPSGTLYLVGEHGLLARGTPGNFVTLPTPVTERLTTIHGAGANLYAVGGLREAAFLRASGNDWRSVPIPGAPSLLNGVAVSSSGETVIVGLEGYVAVGQGDAFTVQPKLTSRGLHGAAVTRAGFIAVGGELVGAFGRGVLLARGGELQATLFQTWPGSGVPFDAGSFEPDAGQDAGIDAGPEDAGLMLDAGASCDATPNECAPGLSCWFVFGPFRSFCGAQCNDVSECGAYGPGACCKRPGPQVTINVCLPVDGCDGGS